MKKDKYKFTFINGDVVIVLARDFEEAEILAQAEQIRKGRIYQIEDWRKYNNYED